MTASAARDVRVVSDGQGDARGVDEWIDGASRRLAIASKVLLLRGKGEPRQGARDDKGRQKRLRRALLEWCRERVTIS